MNKKTTLAISTLALFGGVLALPLFNSQDASAVAGPPKDEILVGGKCIWSEEGTYYHYDTQTEKYVTDECKNIDGATFDKENKVLTLKNLKVDGSITTGLSGLTVNLIGKNSASAINHSRPKLTITGEGEITLKDGISGQFGPQRYGDLDIIGTTLNIEDGGIFYVMDTLIKDSKVTIKTTTLPESENGDIDFDRAIAGIYAHGLTINNSSLDISGNVPAALVGDFFMIKDDGKNPPTILENTNPIKIINVRLNDDQRIIIGEEECESSWATKKTYRRYYATIGTKDTEYNGPKNGATGEDVRKTFGNYSVKIVADILEGANQEMKVEEIKDLVIRYNRDIDLFEKIMVDGKEVPTGSYTLKSGSTIVTIKSDYLKKLDAGEHTVAAKFEGEEKTVDTGLKLVKKEVPASIPDTSAAEEKKEENSTKSPNSGFYTEDTSIVTFPIILAVLAGLAVSAGAFKMLKKYSE